MHNIKPEFYDQTPITHGGKLPFKIDFENKTIQNILKVSTSVVTGHKPAMNKQRREADQREHSGGASDSKAKPLGNTYDLTGQIKNSVKIIVDGQERLAIIDKKGSVKLISSIDDKRSLAYERQTAARLVLDKEHRIKFCGRWNVSQAVKDLSVAIIKSKTGIASYRNLSKCGLGWVCPVCAMRISDKRREEMNLAQDLHDKSGGARYLITYTMPHGIQDSLSDLYDKIREARMYMIRHRDYKTYFNKENYVGEIRALEVTYSKNNGWHPHIHSVIFMKNKFQSVEKLKEKLFSLWSKACVKVGLPCPSFEHGVDVKESAFASDYIAKWGYEMTRWHQKKGHLTSMSPFQFLDAFADEKDNVSAYFYAEKFKEFVEATKGSRQLSWSKGLKSHFKVDEISDEEIMVDEDKDSDLFGWITAEQWKFIRTYKGGKGRVKSDLRFSVLKVAQEKSHISEVIDFIESKGCPYERRFDQEIGFDVLTYRSDFGIIDL